MRSILCIFSFHISNDSLPTLVHVDMLDADKLLAALGFNAMPFGDGAGKLKGLSSTCIK
jgi:hypothetical protein